MQTPSRRWPWLVLLLVILSTAALRWHLRAFPLERDEGEYAYAGQLLLHGVPPYTLLYTMKLPGTSFAYAAILLGFGQTSVGTHLGLLVVNAITIGFMFLLARRLFGDLAGIVAATAYAILTASPAVLGFAGHATNFVLLFAVPAALLLLEAVETRRSWLLFWSGLLFGIGFLMKQPGVLLAVFGAVYILRCEWSDAQRLWSALVKHIATFAAGVALPFVAICLLMLSYGVFGRFWFWTFSYAHEYGAITNVTEGADNFLINFHVLLAAAPWIWLLAAMGVTAVFWSASARNHRFFLVSFLLFSFLAVCPGLYFRRHYFILLLPAVALLVGVAVTALTDVLKSDARDAALPWGPSAFFVVACALSLYQQRAYLFQMSSMAAYQSIYQGSPFPEAIEIASYLRSHSAPDARIAVLGSEPEIYFYADRRSATGYIYTYGLMEPQPFAGEMQQQMIGEIEAARPEYMVFVGVPGSFGRLATSDPLIFGWMDDYLVRNYDIVGVADMLEPTRYLWDAAAQAYRPKAPRYVKVYKRK